MRRREGAIATRGVTGPLALGLAVLGLAAGVGPGRAQPAGPPGLPELTVAAGGPAEDPAYLPVHAALALGTFEAEGVRVTLRRAKHPTAAVTALRQGEADVAVTGLDQAVREAWARGLRVRVLVAHTRAPAAALVVGPAARPAVTRPADLRGRKAGIPGPGTTGALLLAALLRSARLDPVQVQPVSVSGAAVAARLAAGDLAAAVVDEPWLSRLLAAGAATALIDFRRPEETARVLGGPFYEVVSVTRDPAPGKDGKPAPGTAAPEAALSAFVRAVLRAQAWLQATPPADVAARLPASLAGDRPRLAARLAPLQAAYAPGGEATLDGLASTLRVLRGGTPWPVSLELEPKDLREPELVTRARAALGPAPPVP